VEVEEMSFSRKDIVTTAAVAAILVPYLGYLLGADVPFVHTAREMAATALLLGIVAATAAGGPAYPGPHGRTAGWISALTAGGGTALIVWAEPGLLSELLLALFIGSIVLVWRLVVPPQVAARNRTADSARHH
jgi:hypothetical protein